MPIISPKTKKTHSERLARPPPKISCGSFRSRTHDSKTTGIERNQQDETKNFNTGIPAVNSGNGDVRCLRGVRERSRASHMSKPKRPVLSQGGRHGKLRGRHMRSRRIVRQQPMRSRPDRGMHALSRGMQRRGRQLQRHHRRQPAQRMRRVRSR
jgi:hypothetical protein